MKIKIENTIKLESIDFTKVNKCIENAKHRIEHKRNYMNPYSYISYYAKRYEMTYDEELYCREVINTYVEKNLNELFTADFTINGLAY